MPRRRHTSGLNPFSGSEPQNYLGSLVAVGGGGTYGSYPTNTTLLDDFAGSAGTDSNWSMIAPSGFFALNRDGSGHGVSPTPGSGTFVFVYLNTAKYGADSEAFFQVTTVGSNTIRVGARVQNAGLSTRSGYWVSITSAGVWSIIRIDNGGSPTTLATGSTQALSANDWVGIDVTGTVVKGFYSSNGTTWTSKVTYDTASDATKYTTSGYLSVEFQGATQIDNFKGGTKVAAGGGTGGGGTGGGPSPNGSSLPAFIAPLNVSPTQTYYVDAAIGDDTRTAAQANSPSTPWKTIQHALDGGIPIPSVGANTPVRLYVRGTDGGSNTRGFTITATGPGSAAPTGYGSGAVYQPARNLSFPPDSPLLIQNYPGERVLVGFVVKHSVSDSNVCWRATTVNGTLKGLVFDPLFPGGNRTSTGAWYCVGSTNLELFHVEVRNAVWNASGAGIYVGAYSSGGTNAPAKNVQIWNSYVHHNGGANVGSHGIYYGGTSGTQLVGSVGGCVVNCKVVFNYVDNICPHNDAQGLVLACNTASGWGGGGAAGATSTTPVTGDSNHQAFTDGITYFNAGNGYDSANNAVVNNILANNYAYGLNVNDP